MTAARKRPVHWTARHVGRAVPCWALVRRVFDAEHGIALPERQAGDWHKVESGEEREFDLIVFSLGGVEDHVGMIVSPGQMLHSDGETPSRVERYDTGRFLPRLEGVYRHDRLAGALLLPDGKLPLTAPLKPAADMVNVVGLPFLNPARERIELRLPSGVSLAEIVRTVFPLATDEQRARMGVRIGAHEVPAGNWRKVYPLPGMVVTVTPMPGGFFRTIIGLAAFVAGTYFLGPAVGLQLGFAVGSVGASITTALVTGALVLGTSLLLNAFVPARKAKEKGETFLASGWRNAAIPYGVVPAPYGKTRQAPPFGAFSYLEVVGDAVFLRSLFVHGIGRLALSGHRIGDTELYKPESEWAVPGVPEFNFAGVEIEHREGIVGDLPLTIYQHQVIPTDTMGANIPVTPFPGAWVTRVSARDAQDLEIIIGFPGGLSTFDSSGEIDDAGVRFDLEYRAIGAPTWTAVPELAWVVRAQTTAFFVSHRWTPPERGQYEVRIRVNTIADWDADTGDLTRNKFEWLQLYAHRPEYPLNFPVPLALTAIRIKGTEQLKGELDSYNCLVSRVCPDWDSASETWITRETANSASLFRFALQGAVNAKPSTDAQINLPELQRWHERNTLKNLKYHLVHDFDASLPEVLASIAHAGRATQRHDGRKWGVVVDEPREVISGHVSPRNGWDIEVSRPTQRLPHAFKISFRDETSNYEIRERIVPFPGYTLETASLFETLELPGKTHPDEIWIEARRRQYELIYRPKVYTASAPWEAMTFARGMKVMLDDGLRRTTTAGYVQSVDAATGVVEIDEWVTQIEGEEYEVRFRTLKAEGDEAEDDPPAESLVRTVTTVAGKSKLLILSGSGGLPAEDDLAIFGKVEETGREVLVSRVENGEHFTALLTFLDAAPEIDELTDAEVAPDWDGRVGEVYAPDPIAPAVPIITDIRSGVDVDGDVRVYVTEGLDSQPAATFDVEHRLQGAVPWTVMSITPAAGYAEIVGVYDLGDTIEVRARAIGQTALQSAYTATAEHLFGEDDTVIEGFSAFRLATGTWQFVWEFNEHPSAGVKIRYRAGIWLNWSDLAPLHTGSLAAASPWTSVVPEAEAFYTFGIAPVDADGVEVGTPILTMAGTPPALVFSDPRHSMYLAII